MEGRKGVPTVMMPESYRNAGAMSARVLIGSLHILMTALVVSHLNSFAPSWVCLVARHFEVCRVVYAILYDSPASTGLHSRLILSSRQLGWETSPQDRESNFLGPGPKHDRLHELPRTATILPRTAASA